MHIRDEETQPRTWGKIISISLGVSQEKKKLKWLLRTLVQCKFLDLLTETHLFFLLALSKYNVFPHCTLEIQLFI